MEPESQILRRPTRRLKPAQFSLATAFAVTAGLSILSALVFVAPSVIAGPAFFLMILAVPAVLMIGVKYGSGNWPAFCLGAFVPSGVNLVGITFNLLEIANEGDRFVTLTPNPTKYDPLGPFTQWFEAIVTIGIRWRPMALGSWAAAVLVGLLCVAARCAIRRRGQ